MKKISINSKKGSEIIERSSKTGEIGVLPSRFAVYQTKHQSVITNMHLVKDAKQFVVDYRNEGVICPCCEQFVKVYYRGIHSLMAMNLMQLYKITKAEGDGYYHVNDFAKPFGGGDFAKLRFWGLIEQETDEIDPTKRTSGKWRITEKGKLFCQNEYSVPKKIIFLNGKPVDQLSEYTTIVECLGKKFDYQ